MVYPTRIQTQRHPSNKIYGEYVKERTQGFYHTGQYFFVQHEHVIDTLVHVIQFNQDKASFEHKKVRVELPFNEEYHGSYYPSIDPSTRTLIHTVQRWQKINSTSDYILDVYKYDIVEFLNNNHGHDLTIEEKSSPDLSLVYDESRFSSFDYDLIHLSGDSELSMVFYASFRDDKTSRYHPRCCVQHC